MTENNWVSTEVIHATPFLLSACFFGPDFFFDWFLDRCPKPKKPKKQGFHQPAKTAKALSQEATAEEVTDFRGGFHIPNAVAGDLFRVTGSPRLDGVGSRVGDRINGDRINGFVITDPYKWGIVGL